MSAPMAHAVPDAGGVGGTIGACLAHLGDSVMLVVRPDELAQYPRAHCISKAGLASSM